MKKTFLAMLFVGVLLGSCGFQEEVFPTESEDVILQDQDGNSTGSNGDPKPPGVGG